MQRVIKLQRGVVDDLNELKYILQQEYNGFGIYQEMCPSGLYKHQSWLMTDGSTALVCCSFNNFCKEELLDMIDNYKENRKFGIKGFFRGIAKPLSIYIAHDNGNQLI